MKKRLLLAGLVLLSVVPLALVLRSFARDAIVTPVLHLLWLGHLLFQSIPQALLWGLLLVIALLVFARSLIKSQAPMGEVHKVERDRPGQVTVWARRIHMMSRGSYYEWSLAQHLRRLFLAVMAYRQRLSRERTRMLLEAGKLDVPPRIRLYLEAAREPTSLRPLNLFSRLAQLLRLSRQESALDLDPETVVRFLEEQIGGST